MADFIAVIRRAVDGLTENTPEMRVKVYERARGAVQRQLENMKPRPPEAMLQRQLEKLDAAIREVEAEHAEALPDDNAVALEPVAAAEAIPEPVYEEPAAEAPVEEPVHAAAEPVEEAAPEEHPAYEEPVADQEPAAAEPAYEEPQPIYHEEAAPAAEPEVHAEEPAPWQQPAEDAPAETWHAPQHEEPVEPEHHVAAETAVFEEHHAEPEPVEAVEPLRASEYNPANRLVEPFASFEKPQEFVEQTQEEPLQSDAAGRFEPVWSEPVAEAPAEPPKDAETVWADQELHNFSALAPAANADSGARAFEEALSGLSSVPEPAKMPPAHEGFSWEAAAFDDLPPIDAPKKAAAAPHADDSDLFSEVHGNKAAPAQPAPDVPGSEWKEAESLRGYGRRGSVANDDDDTAPVADIDQIVAAKLQNKNFRMEPKRRRFGLGRIIGTLVALAVLGGGGYAAWMKRDELNAMVNGLISSAPKTAETTKPAATTPPPATTPASGTAPAANDSSAAPAESNKQVAAVDDGASVSNKFNQRLMADGSETDPGPATVATTPTAEGKSVAQQSVASAAPAVQAQATPAAQPGAANAQQPPATDAPAPAAAQTQTPVGASEKMFLYEERIGQSSPTAIQGSVVWSVQHEKGANGKDEATVQGNVTVPERNLSALVTFKRNSDPSLPASHLVEIVFSVPPNFEGGKIDSVQRISMKRTEQDRGDALIAVPAKITDDFHMIALNDYPDARKSNLDLLATRDWIDIPITYRNGRRALITMQKGSTGGAAFNTAISSWTALGDVSTSQ
ncbi:hypothetical protein [Rhizobium sp. BE258]|uniref:hypothetical protein n=1 Tax=Rhizobium sp. BE258 TaxID=2817722 RepID=UPI00286556AE|nr:hypothetical protein [Rhizobium sp. BE258]MDR7144015.1 cytoskeletal protein RodZ [Rhizobium sp. BE258]